MILSKEQGRYFTRLILNTYKLLNDERINIQPQTDFKFAFDNNITIQKYRLAKVQAYIISSLGQEMPTMFGKDGKKKELIKNLDALYGQLQREHKILPGDFPDIEHMKAQIIHQDFTKFRRLDKVRE